MNETHRVFDKLFLLRRLLFNSSDLRFRVKYPLPIGVIYHESTAIPHICENFIFRSLVMIGLSPFNNTSLPLRQHQYCANPLAYSSSLIFIVCMQGLGSRIFYRYNTINTSSSIRFCGEEEYPNTRIILWRSIIIATYWTIMYNLMDISIWILHRKIAREHDSINKAPPN